MIGVVLFHFILWLTEILFPGPVTGMAHDDAEMEEDWEGEMYIEGGA